MRSSLAPTRFAPESWRTPERPSSTASGRRLGRSFRAGWSSWAHHRRRRVRLGPAPRVQTPAAALREVPFAAESWRSARWPRSSPPRCSRFSIACFPQQRAPTAASGIALGDAARLVDSARRALYPRAALSRGAGQRQSHHPGAGPDLWVGLGSGLAALVGLSLTDYALSPGSWTCPCPCNVHAGHRRQPPRDRASIVDGALAVRIALPCRRLARDRFGCRPLPPRALDGRRAPCASRSSLVWPEHGLASPRSGSSSPIATVRCWPSKASSSCSSWSWVSWRWFFPGDRMPPGLAAPSSPSQPWPWSPCFSQRCSG